VTHPGRRSGASGGRRRPPVGLAPVGLAPVGLALVVVVLSAVACASPSPPRSAPSTSAATSTATSTTVTPANACGVLPGAGVTITSSTGPCALTTSVGDVVRVALDAGFTWGDPRSDSTAVVVRDVVRPPGGGLSATLSAAAVGRATVSSAGTVACAPGHACPQLARLWQVEVTVTP